MTAAETDPTPATLGEPAQSVTYPISVDYVKSWTLVRALAEAVANAIDADPDNFQVTYDDSTGELLIEDYAEQGVGVESMVFGWSDKTGRTDVIGQFGEGLKIATIRAVSDPAVRHMIIESVGVTIVPTVAEHTAVAGLAIPVKSAKAPKVLRWDLYPSERPLGTLVRVGVSRSVAEEVMGRFRHIAIPGYTAPSGSGTVVPTDPGRVWIGGVLVKEVPGLVFGYDLSLTAAKRLQNRDRTVIESYALSSAIATIQNDTTDPYLLAGWAEAALNGTLAEPERSITRYRVSTADQRRAWAQVSTMVLGDPTMRYYRKDRYDTQSALVLDDENMVEVVTNGLNQYDFVSFMNLLGVKPASVARATRPNRSVRWAKRLTRAEQTAVDGSVATLRTIFGPDAIGRVRVYEEVLDASRVSPCSWLGFYEPRSGDIAVDRLILTNQTTLDETLFHETGHRIAHRGLLGGHVTEHADRSRGFEEILGRMAVRMMTHLVQGRTLSQFQPPTQTRPLLPCHVADPPSGRRLTYRDGQRTRYPRAESTLGPRVRVLAVAGLLRWAEGRGIAERSMFAAYAKEHYVTTARVRQLLVEPIGSQIGYQHFLDVLSPLGVDPAVAWWATTGVMSVWSNRRSTSKNRAFTRQARADAARACGDLLAGPYAEFAQPLRDLADGNGQVRPEWDDDRWMSPILDLLTQAEEDHADPAHTEQAAALAEIPGGETAQQAWDAYQDALAAREATRG